MERKRTYFASDVHLGLRVNDPAEREKRFVRFLKAIPVEETESLYLLGDIWDFWYEYRDVVPKGYVRVFSALMDLIDAGVNVYFFQGNHDIWTYSYFEELGIKILKQPALIEIHGKTFCLGHGDGLGPGHKWYKLMRGAFHNKVLQSLFSLVHPWLAFRLGQTWSRQSRVTRWRRARKGRRKEKEKQRVHTRDGKLILEKSSIYNFALDYSTKNHVDYFIFGHYHHRVDVKLPSGSRFCILKDWIDGDSYLHFDGILTWGGYSQNME